MSVSSEEQQLGVRIFRPNIDREPLGGKSGRLIVRLPKTVREEWGLINPHGPKYLDRHVTARFVQDTHGPAYVLAWPAVDGGDGQDTVTALVEADMGRTALPDKYYTDLPRGARLLGRAMLYNRLIVISTESDVLARLEALPGDSLDPDQRAGVREELTNPPKQGGRLAEHLTPAVLGKLLFPGTESLIARRAM